MSRITLMLVFCMTLNTVMSQLALKKAMATVGRLEALSGLPAFLLAAAHSPWVWLSLGLQVVGYVAWMAVLSREKVAAAVAVSGAIFYGLVALGSWLILGERLSPAQWAGIALISAGVLLARG